MHDATHPETWLPIDTTSKAAQWRRLEAAAVIVAAVPQTPGSRPRISYALPHDEIALLASQPGAETWVQAGHRVGEVIEVAEVEVCGVRISGQLTRQATAEEIAGARK